VSARPARLALVAEVCGLLDAAASGPVLVYGSLPPEGRDLDLLVGSGELDRLRTALRAAGLAEHGLQLVRFGCGAAYSVELEPADAWRLPAVELEELFACSSPLRGFARLSQPAPHHRLLILAFVVLGGERQPVLSEGRRERIATALAQQPRAWELAGARAAAWGDPAALARLRDAFEHRAAPAPARGRLLARPRRGALIALSGIDGAGKSFQAEALGAALRDLGYETAVVWLPLGQNRSLDRIARPIKRLLARRAGVRSPDGAAQSTVPGAANRAVAGGEGASGTGALLRQRSPLINSGWAVVVALANALTHLRHGAPHLLSGRVVVFDRYVLDSIVRLRFSYGRERPFTLQRRLIRMLSPRPLCAFFLDISAETSLARKEDRWRAEELRAHVELYRRELPRFAVRRLDGERSPQELASEIGHASWRALYERRRRSRRRWPAGGARLRLR
jgi:thymidylate kinase